MINANHKAPHRSTRGILARIGAMKRSERRILTTHVGSLVRTPELRALAQSGVDRPKEASLNAGYLQIPIELPPKW